jgi:hypothetical protein
MIAVAGIADIRRRRNGYVGLLMVQAGNAV